MIKGRELLKLFLNTIKHTICMFFIGGSAYLAVTILYKLTHEENEIDGVLSKRKYRRIKQAVRYKIWFWKHMRWLCKIYNVRFDKYMKYDKNKKILRY